ncbi:putative flavohemoglobin / bacterial hemoglobin [Dinoroseobacter shibae DFL 12 = DSM 16493]|uniref:Putative flavohemoglobin / bacterial hemoglobin n=1 Tax=Dinoroseobacter shibae (strain DSM 16493 / NCIMB 14021 / DFL 12) TaxID=398580 RepID=A8LNC0_DINSH|nr:globin family protein [Dinoroseobacter shibae]ABV93633.1 putative flavohemoglobin / bacterial hemoglobin [Dinoroseobacter shibae DFL 12 = DSM 16493]URF49388.1 globin domain-containing protein [Dinoroseobacter shibae]
MPTDASLRVQNTWALVAPISDQVGDLFYANLFRMDPTTKPLFAGNIDLQGRKLVQTLGFIVDHLEDPDRLLPAAQELAVRHVSYGVTRTQYASVGAALVKSLRQLLGTAFSPEDEAAWAEVYGGLSAAMIAAAYPDTSYTKV